MPTSAIKPAGIWAKLRHVKKIVAGAHLPTWMQRVLLHPLVQFSVAFGALLLGLLVSLWSDPIRDATRLAFLSILGRVEGDTFLQPWVLGFWIAATLWATLAYLRLIADALDARQNITRLEAVAYRAPNPSVVLHYARYIRLATETVDRWQRIHETTGNSTANSDDTRTIQTAAAASCVVDLLRVSATLAAEFSLAADQDSYGASVMLISASPLEETWRTRLSFGFGRYDLGTFGGVLETPQALTLPNLPWHPARNPLLINLPFPEVTRTSVVEAFPGPPTAVLSGQAIVVENTVALHEASAKYDDHIRTSVATYFGPNGPGKAVQSQFSIRIGHEANEPVGVLVIDASRPFLLGREPEYYESFLGLLTPILNLLASPIATYASLAAGRVETGEPLSEPWSSDADEVFSRYLDTRLVAETRNRSERNSTVTEAGGIVAFGTKSPLQRDYRSSADSTHVRLPRSPHVHQDRDAIVSLRGSSGS